VIALLFEPFADFVFFMFQMLAPLAMMFPATLVIWNLSACRFGESGRYGKCRGGEGKKAELASEHSGYSVL
jgi:hypothetical protein